MLYMLKMDFELFILKSLVSNEMLLLYIFIYLTVVEAGWPPSNCNLAPNGQHVVLTSSSVEVSECVVPDLFERTIYVQLSRTHMQAGTDSESILEIDMVNDDEFASIQISDSQITLDADNKCAFGSVKRVVTPFWLRVQLRSMLDTQKTYVRVALSDRNDGVFEDCAVITTSSPQHQFQMRFEGETKNGMRQLVHAITAKRPTGNQKDLSDVTSRMDRLETRLQRLQSVVTRYIDSHDRHKSETLDQHKYLKSAIAGAHNRIVTRSNAHGLFYVFMFVIVLLCGFTYAKLEYLDKQRFHMP